MQQLNSLDEALQLVTNIFDSYFSLEIIDGNANREMNINARQLWKNVLVNILVDTKFNRKDKVEFKHKMLLILAENTGCMEDQELSDEILKALIAENLIEKQDLLIYERNKMTNRWE